MKNRLLVTGFGPFEHVVSNPSEVLASASGHEHKTVEVSYEATEEFVGNLDPDSFGTLLLLGAHGSASQFQVELVARNRVEERADISGLIPRNPEIMSGGPELLTGTLWPAVDLDPFLQSQSAVLSEDAGAYLCNFIYYKALLKFPAKKVGFLHVPLETAMPIERQHAQLGRLIEAIKCS